MSPYGVVVIPASEIEFTGLPEKALTLLSRSLDCLTDHMFIAHRKVIQSSAEVRNKRIVEPVEIVAFDNVPAISVGNASILPRIQSRVRGNQIRNSLVALVCFRFSAGKLRDIRRMLLNHFLCLPRTQTLFQIDTTFL